MGKYVTYLRTLDGSIERQPDAIVMRSEDSMNPYTHEEALVGWPEPKIYWANDRGPSVGLAPLSSSAH
jgi:hypothetical protein